MQPLYTPGHTDGHFSYLCGDRVFTSDALLIEGAGALIFKTGMRLLIQKRTGKNFFPYPKTAWYTRRMIIMTDGFLPLHRKRSVVPGWEITVLGRNQGNNAHLDLLPPKFIDYALPGNWQCGVCP